MTEFIHPGFVLIIGALLLPFVMGPARKPFLMLVPILAFISVLNMQHGTYGVVNFMDWELTFGRVDAFDCLADLFSRHAFTFDDQF